MEAIYSQANKPTMSNINLTKKERLSLVLQLRTLQKLTDEEYEKAEYENMITALLHGYTLHYNDLFNEFYEEELSIEECRYVLSILEMYRGIIYSYIELERNNQLKSLKQSDICFPGFDGNDDKESSYLGYSRYFVRDLGRYDEISERTLDDFNSHCKMCEKYDRMLAMWNKFDSIGRYKMSEERIKDLLEA